MEIEKEYMDLIKSYSHVCFKKLRKPACMEYEDLISEGVIKYIEVTKSCKTNHETFKAFLAVSLQRAYGRILSKSYKKDIEYIDITACHTQHTKSVSIVSQVDAIANLTSLSKNDLTFLVANMNPSDDLKELLKTTVSIRKKIREFIGFTRKEENQAITNIKTAIYA